MYLAFKCLGAINTFEWVVMPFGLKNTRPTYQRAMNFFFLNMIGKFMEVYIDDIIVKWDEVSHLDYLDGAFIRMDKYHLNPFKYAFVMDYISRVEWL